MGVQGVLVLICVALAAALLWTWTHMRQRLRQAPPVSEHEEKLRLALWASGEELWDYDLAHSKFRRWRARGTAPETAELELLVQDNPEQDVHPQDLEGLRQRMREHLRGETEQFIAEHRLSVLNPERWKWIRLAGRVIARDPFGRATRMIGLVHDISEVYERERERRIAIEVLSSMREAVSVLNGQFDFIAVNPAFLHTTGYEETEVIGNNAAVLDSTRQPEAFYRQVRAQLREYGEWNGEMWQRRKDGQEVLCALRLSAVRDPSSQEQLYVAVLNDITEQRRTEQELRYLANFDPLTGLPNRTLLGECLSQAIVAAQRDRLRVAVLFIDLDRFKEINDSLGHVAGDRVLHAAAMRLQHATGSRHTVARLGGDEFMLIMEGIHDPAEADRCAREIIMAFDTPLPSGLSGGEASMSCSIGISLYPDHAQLPTDLLKHADTAMYQAKAAGRRTYMRYVEEMDTAVRQRASISAALRKVLDRHELYLVFQPRLALDSSRIVGVEALLRWRSPEHGQVEPSYFVPLAEENGLILDIGEWVLRQACRIVGSWRQLGLDGLSVSVNVSALQLLHSDFPSVVQRVLADVGLPASALELELTESVVMGNAEQAADSLQALRELGVALAIDDFGTGYSSLAYLKRLPIDTLKIDKAFIHDLTIDDDDAAITNTIITMGHSLGLSVVAEGVETAAQLQHLARAGCDEIQGYWLARPMTETDCLNFLHDYQAAPAARALP